MHSLVNVNAKLYAGAGLVLLGGLAVSNFEHADQSGSVGKGLYAHYSSKK